MWFYADPRLPHFHFNRVTQSNPKTFRTTPPSPCVSASRYIHMTMTSLPVACP